MCIPEGIRPVAHERQNLRTQDPSDRGGHVSVLASRVVAAAVDRLSRNNPPSDVALIRRLTDAALSRETHALDDEIGAMRREGITVEHLCDIYIPEVARSLGAQWCSDELGFAEVTIGTARLQGQMRDLHREIARSSPVSEDGPQVLLIVLEDDFHTLGSVVLAGQMRRKGIGVRLLLGQPDDDIINAVGLNCYDVVMFSLSDVAKLDHLGNLIGQLRGLQGPVPPIVVGGIVLEFREDIDVVVGADFAASDLEEAFDHCGVMIPAKRKALEKTKV